MNWKSSSVLLWQLYLQRMRIKNTSNNLISVRFFPLFCDLQYSPNKTSSVVAWIRQINIPTISGQGHISVPRSAEICDLSLSFVKHTIFSVQNINNLHVMRSESAVFGLLVFTKIENTASWFECKLSMTGIKRIHTRRLGVRHSAEFEIGWVILINFVCCAMRGQEQEFYTNMQMHAACGRSIQRGIPLISFKPISRANSVW